MRTDEFDSDPPKDADRYPHRDEINAAARNTLDLLLMGEQVAEYVENRRSGGLPLDPDWHDQLHRNVAILKDLIEADAPANSASTELAITLRNPIDFNKSKYGDPTIKLTTHLLGVDDARSAKFFFGAGIALVFAALAFSVLVYGFKPPSPASAVVVASVGGISLAISGALLGWGLFRIYVEFSFILAGSTIFSAVARRGHFLSSRLAYSTGSALFGSAVALIVLVGRIPEVAIVDDATNLRLASLASFALGIPLLGVGAWPIIESIILDQRRRDGFSRTVSPRMLIPALPAIAGLMLLLMNWLLKS